MTATKYGAEAQAAHRRMVQAIAAGKQHADPNLSAQGLSIKRQELADAARAAGAAELARIKDAAERAAESAKTRADKVRPTIDDYAKASAKWAQAEMLLQKGRPVYEIVKVADLDMTLAVADYWPAFAASRAAQGQPLDLGLGGLQRAVDDRIAALAGKEVGEAIHAAREATIDAEQAAVYASSDGRDPMQTALAARMVGA